MSGLKWSLKGRPLQHKAKPLVSFKGQILDFYFLNNRHNCSTVTLMWMLPFKSNHGWKKGQVPGSQGSLDSVCTSLYSWQCVSAALSLHHQFLSISRKKKRRFLLFQIALLLPWLGSAIDWAIHPSQMYVPIECKWQLNVYTVTKGLQKAGAMEQQWESLSVERWQCHLWRWVNRKRTQWNYKAFSLTPRCCD